MTWTAVVLGQWIVILVVGIVAGNLAAYDGW